MSQNQNKYQAIILKDVQSENYEEHLKHVWYGFFAIWGLGLTFYAAVLVKQLKLIGFSFSELVQAVVRDPHIPSLTTLYFHEAGVLLLGFGMALVIFALLAFLIYDIAQRNEVIRQQLNKNS